MACDAIVHLIACDAMVHLIACDATASWTEPLGKKYCMDYTHNAQCIPCTRYYMHLTWQGPWLASRHRNHRAGLSWGHLPDGMVCS